MFLVYLINLINVGPTLNLRGEVVLNLQPVNGVSKVKVVGLPNHYQTDNRGFFNFSIKDEKQEQITLRAEYNNWIGSKIFSRGNLLSIELPLTSEILEELIKPDFGNQRTAFFSGYSFGESAYYDKKAGGGAFTYSFIKNIQQDMSLNIGGLFEQIDTEMRLRIKNMRSPRLWVSDKKLPEEKLFNVEDESGKQTLALVIGISRYMDNRIPSLKYSVSDAMRVQEFFFE